MIDKLKQLDNFEVPNDLTDADAEYVRIKLARTTSAEDAEKYRDQLHIIEDHLNAQHKELLKRIHKHSRSA